MSLLLSLAGPHLVFPAAGTPNHSPVVERRRTGVVERIVATARLPGMGGSSVRRAFRGGGLGLDATWSFELQADGRARMVLHGDVDIADENRLVEEIDAHLRDATSGELVIDLSDVDFVDSSGVRAFIRVRRLHGARLTLGPLSEPVRRVFDIAGLVQVFDGDATG